MSLTQDQKNTINTIASMVDAKAESTPLIGMAVAGGMAVADKLGNVADKESAAEALFLVGGSCIGAADPFDDEDFMQMNIGLISLYAASQLIK